MRRLHDSHLAIRTWPLPAHGAGPWTLLLALLIAATLATPAGAAVPGTVFMRGALRAADGSPVSDGSYDLSFALYDVQSGGTAVWAEGPVKLTVKGGAFEHTLGSVKPIAPAVVRGLKAGWLGVAVGGDPELPRTQLHAAPWALVAAETETLACTGCVSVSEMKFDGDVDLGSHTLKTKTVVSPQVQAGTVTATSFIGDGSKLTGIATMSGTCPKGQAVQGVDKAGQLVCVAANGALPMDGIDDVSNGLLSNEFKNLFEPPGLPVGIDDNNPVGTTSTIDVPDVGVAKKLTVNVNLTNSDMKSVEVYLYDAANTAYTLYNKNGAGKSLVTSYPTPTKPLSGDLTVWEGKNPKGKWRLRVVDSAFLNNAKDGAIVNWSVQVDTVSTKKVQVNGKLLVDAKLEVGGLVKVGPNKAVCSDELKGAIRYQDGAMQWCDGGTWRNFGGRGAMYRWTTWSTYNVTNGQWYAGNNASLFGGVAPSSWSGNALASSIQPSSSQLRAFFVRRGPDIGTVSNQVVYAREYRMWDVDNSRHVAALFRVRNTTSAEIKWKVSWYRTAYAAWGERASIAVNGSNVWDSGSNSYGGNSASTHDLPIPGGRTSTVIFVVGSSQHRGDSHNAKTRTVLMSFYNNSLALPNGLAFVDDLATKPDGWNN